MDVGVIWGIVFTAYIVSGIYPLMKANNGPRPQETISGSSKLKMWEEKEKNGNRALLIWGVGFCVLIAAFSGYTKYETSRLRANAIATAYKSSDKTTADYIALLRETAPDNNQVAGSQLVRSPSTAISTYDPSAPPSPVIILAAFVVAFSLLALVTFLSVKGWKERGRLYPLVIYVLARAYRLNKKATTKLAVLAKDVKQAAEK